MDRKKDKQNAPLQVWIPRTLKAKFDGVATVKGISNSALFEIIAEYYFHNHRT